MAFMGVSLANSSSTSVLTFLSVMKFSNGVNFRCFTNMWVEGF